MTLFTHTLNYMIENNEMNNDKFSIWLSADEAIDCYSTYYVKRDCHNNIIGFQTTSDEEMDATRKALNMIIRSNGKELQQAKDMFNAEIKELIK